MGGFVAGSIVAKLLLDKTGWNQSIQAVGKDQKNLAESAQKIGESFKEVGIKLAAAGAVITAVFSTMIHKTSQYGDKLDEISQRTGVSVEALSGLRLAAEKNSVSIEALANGFKFLSMNMVEASSGAGDGAKLFNALGISVKDSTGKLKDSSAIMIEVADVFAGMQDGATKTALAVKLFGRAGMDMIPILNLGSEGLKEQRDLAEKLGITFTKDSAKGAANFRDSLVDLKASAEGIGKEIAMSLMPTVNNLVKAVTSVVIKMREWMGAHPGVTQALSLTGLAIGGVLTGMGAFIFTIGTIIQKLTALSTAMGVARLSILATTGVIAGAITAVVIYAAKLMELKVAEDYVNEADKRLQEGENKLVESLSKAAVAADWQYGRMSKLIEAYHGNIAALAMAIQKGKEGKDIQEALAKVGKEENVVIEEQRKKLGVLGTSLLDVATKQKTWGETMQEWGILPLQDKIKRIGELLGYETRLNQMLRDGKIDATEYGKGIKALNDELNKLGSSTVTRVLPPARDFADVLKRAVPTMNDLAYSTGTFEDQLKAAGDAMGVSANTILRELYNIRRAFLMTMGIMIPEWKDFEDAAKTAATETSNAFDGLYNDVARGFGDMIQSVLAGTTSLKDGLKGLFNEIKTAFFRMIGEMMAEWTLKFIKKILADIGLIKPAADAAAKAATAAGTAGGSGLSSGIGAGVTAALSAIGMIVGAFSAFISLINILSTMKKLTAIERAEFDRAYEEMQRKAGVIVAPSTGRKRTEEETEPNQDGGWQTGFHGIVSSPIRPLIGEVPERVDITPLSKLSHMTVEKNKKERPIEIHNEVHIQGQIITDREYVRYRLIPEIISAMDSHYKKSQLQASLGVG